MSEPSQAGVHEADHSPGPQAGYQAIYTRSRPVTDFGRRDAGPYISPKNGLKINKKYTSPVHTVPDNFKKGVFVLQIPDSLDLQNFVKAGCKILAVHDIADLNCCNVSGRSCQRALYNQLQTFSKCVKPRSKSCEGRFFYKKTVNEAEGAPYEFKFRSFRPKPETKPEEEDFSKLFKFCTVRPKPETKPEEEDFSKLFTFCTVRPKPPQTEAETKSDDESEDFSKLFKFCNVRPKPPQTEEEEIDEPEESPERPVRERPTRTLQRQNAIKRRRSNQSKAMKHLKLPEANESVSDDRQSRRSKAEDYMELTFVKARSRSAEPDAIVTKKDMQQAQTSAQKAQPRTYNRLVGDDRPQQWQSGTQPSTSEDRFLVRMRWRMVLAVSSLVYLYYVRKRQITTELKNISDGLQRMNAQNR